MKESKINQLLFYLILRFSLFPFNHDYREEDQNEQSDLNRLTN